MTQSALGAISPARFLRQHWQKRPFVARAAIDGIDAWISPQEILRLACRDDVESRLVTRFDKRWSVAHGPFRARELKRLPDRDWTLLVQGVDTLLPQARALMSLFSFIPYARQDDLMVSIAPPGGGVGPHFDSYDVFLVQARGRRRWRIGAQSDLRLIEDAPLKILKRFRHDREFVAEPGDVLYLPPSYAHDGVAETDCMTCSVGFRAPSASDLMLAFLQWLEDDIKPAGRYADPRLTVAEHPAEIGDAMVRQVARLLRPIGSWRSSMERFLGEHLTEPKPHIWFQPPTRPIPVREFTRRARNSGVRLGLKTGMLFRGRYVFMNGEAVEVRADSTAVFIELADRRELRPLPRCSVATVTQLYAWYRAGFVELV